MENLCEEQYSENKIADVKPEKNYCLGLDIVRVLAMFFVILVHSTDFYDFKYEKINGSIYYFAGGIGRYISLSCVPLFLLLTGYLNCNKTPSWKYYLKILKFLIEFFICAVIIAFVNKFYFKNFSFKNNIINFFTFKFPQYSWYVNMFIGLFLLTPFLNYLYKAIPEKYKKLFIITLILVFSALRITPFWKEGYPIMYYFIGCYIKEKQIKVKKIILLIIIFAIAIFNTVFKQVLEKVYTVETYYNIFCLCISVSIFLLFYDIKSVSCIKPLRIVANASLSTFLISEIFETLNLKFFTNKGLTTYSQKFSYLLAFTPVKFIFSVLFGVVITFVSVIIYKILIKLLAKLCKRG